MTRVNARDIRADKWADPCFAPGFPRVSIVIKRVQMRKDGERLRGSERDITSIRFWRI